MITSSRRSYNRRSAAINRPNPPTMHCSPTDKTCTQLPKPLTQLSTLKSQSALPSLSDMEQALLNTQIAKNTLETCRLPKFSNEEEILQKIFQLEQDAKDFEFHHSMVNFVGDCSKVFDNINRSSLEINAEFERADRALSDVYVKHNEMARNQTISYLNGLTSLPGRDADRELAQETSEYDRLTNEIIDRLNFTVIPHDEKVKLIGYLPIKSTDLDEHLCY